MKKIFLFILVFVCLKGFGQYPNMTNPQSLGAKKTRVTSLGAFDVDSILMGPTGCGSPSFYPAFLGVAVKKAAYYFDSCNHRFWVYDPKIQTWDSLHLGVAATGGGTDNANVGSGFRVLKPSTQELKTLFGSNTILIDSSSNTNGLTFKADTSLIASQYDISGFQNAISFPYTTLKYYTGYGTFGNLTDSVRAALSAGIDILYSGGVISADTTTGSTKLATQGDIDRAIVASIPTLQQVINAGNTIASGANNNTISASAISMTDATNTGYFSPTISYVTNGSEAVAITPSYVSFGTNGFLELLKAQAALSANRDIYLPNGNVTDTLATLANVRSGGGAADGNGIYTGNGSLSGNTTITQSTNTLTFNGSTTGNQILSANSSTGTALKGTTTGGGTGVWGETSGNGWGGYFKSATGNGIEADGGTGTGVYSHTSTGLVFSGINTGNRTANLPVFAIEGNWASTNSNETIAQFKRTSSGTVDDGISGSIDLMIENLSATTLANRLTARWKESTFATRESELDIDGFNAGTQEVFLRLQHRYIMANNLTDTVAYLSDVRAGGGGAVSLSSVGGGDDIQTGGAGNIRTLNTSDFSVGTNLISIDYTNGQAASTSNKGFLTNTDWNTFNNKQAAFTSSEESFTGADLVSYDGTTGFALTVAHSPISTKNRDVFVNTVLVNSYITSISGSIFTIASLPYTISTSDIILIKYNY